VAFAVAFAFDCCAPFRSFELFFVHPPPPPPPPLLLLVLLLLMLLSTLFASVAPVTAWDAASMCCDAAADGRNTLFQCLKEQ
jgi:hypothetical protein